MKKYVILISTKFPKTHSRAGQSTDFPLKIKWYEKIHTIRGNYEFWKKRFDEIDKGAAILSVRIWDGLPYRSKQLEVFKYHKIQGIGIEKIDNPSNFVFASIGGKMINWLEIATNDGLSFDDFCDWFKFRSNKPMAIIHFTDFRYCA